MLHFAFFMLKSTSKTIFEAAIDHYAIEIIKRGGLYSTVHIHELCANDEPIFSDTYATRASGYYTKEQALEKIIESESSTAIDIKNLMIELHKTEDLIIIDEIKRLESKLEDVPEEEVVIASHCIIL